MSEESGQKELAVRYLLGTLSDEEMAQIEERYFSDDAEFEEVEIAEEELIDRYVRGELSTADRNRFETTLTASPRLTERVEFARVWKDKLAASPDPSRAGLAVEPRKPDRRRSNWWNNLFGFSGESRAPRLATAFAVMILLVGGTALLFSWLRGREEAKQLAAQQAEQRQRELDKQAADSKSQADQLATQSPQPSPTVSATPPGQTEDQNSPTSKPFLALTLSPGMTRSQGRSHDLRLTPGTKEVRITLNLRDQDYTSYRAVIQTVDGTAVLSRDGLTPRRTRAGAVLNIQVQANFLRPYDYLIRLEGRTSAGTVEPVDDYSFRIIK